MYVEAADWGGGDAYVGTEVTASRLMEKHERLRVLVVHCENAGFRSVKQSVHDQLTVGDAACYFRGIEQSL